MTDCCVLSRSRRLVFLRIFITLFRLFIQNGLTCTLLYQISVESVVLNSTRAVCSHFCSMYFFRFYRVRLMFFTLVFVVSQISPDIVVPWSWNLIAFILASISEVYFFRDVFQLFTPFRPSHSNWVVAGWRTVIFFLSVGNLIEVCFFLSSFALEGVLAGPGRNLVGRVLIYGVVLAGPGEQLSLVDQSR